MSRSTTHELQPRTDHDGHSRRLAVLACKRAIRGVLEAQLRQDYENQVLPTLERAPTSAADIVERLEQLDSYRAWASATRASQERMWSLLADQIDQDYARIAEAAAELRQHASGSLQLDAEIKMPKYMVEANLHGQPGGYLLDREAPDENLGDLAAGILYEAGGNIYAMGQGIGKKDSKAERLIAYIRETLPDFQPRRILEMGCSAGAQSVDYPQAFPEAEFHALDLSAAVLRFAHVRAEALGAPVHFHQADAAATPFADGYFDLVISHNMFHEVAAGHMPAIMRECWRLLAPGGVCLHQDVPTQTGRFDAWMQFISEWQKEHNDEPFWLDFANADLPAMMVEAGFDAEKVTSTYLEAVDGPIPWYVVTGQKPADY
jgi:ubiquinone/menaquinone biosynthesis C-methylase UbiE